MDESSEEKESARAYIVEALQLRRDTLVSSHDNALPTSTSAGYSAETL